MRYGLMTNLRRSWGKVGERIKIPHQHEYIYGYLYTAIDPLTGDSCHLLGFTYIDTLTTDVFLEQLNKQFPQTHNIIIWDNAPFHRNQTLLKKHNITAIALPSYSPQLNPIERFFEELRKETSWWTYKSITDIETKIENKLKHYDANKEELVSLTAYEYFVKQSQFIGTG